MEASYRFSTRGTRIIGEVIGRVLEGNRHTAVPMTSSEPGEPRIVVQLKSSITREWLTLAIPYREARLLVYELAERLHQHDPACPGDIVALDESAPQDK